MTILAKVKFEFSNGTFELPNHAFTQSLRGSKTWNKLHWTHGNPLMIILSHITKYSYVKKWMLRTPTPKWMGKKKHFQIKSSILNVWPRFKLVYNLRIHACERVPWTTKGRTKLHHVIDFYSCQTFILFINSFMFTTLNFVWHSKLEEITWLSPPSCNVWRKQNPIHESCKLF